MAVMIPDDVEDFCTDGERQFYGFLKTAAKPDSKYLAVALGVDAFLTGEISEQNVHVAQETGVAYIAAGHHATERYGVQALGEHLAARFNLEHRFFDQDNPV